MYIDLSIRTDKAVDLKYFLDKISKNGYAKLVLDYAFTDDSVYKSKPKPFPQLQDQSITLLNRSTIQIQNNASLHPLGQQSLSYDIIAVKPLNEKIFHTLCIQYDSYDVMTFDIANKLPFMLKRNPVYEAIRRGKYFQIYYQPMFDQQSRVVCMTNMVNILKATGGKNLIISSNAGDHSTHRTPFDIAALMISLGLDKNKALQCMKQNPNKVLMSAQHRKFLKGAIKQVPINFGIKLNKRIQKHREGLKKQKQRLNKIQQEK